MQEIVTLVASRGDPHLNQTVPNWTRAPWLEQSYSPAVLEASSPTQRTITTHLPHHLLGPALQGSKAKVRITQSYCKLVRSIFMAVYVNCKFDPAQYRSCFDYFKRSSHQL